MSTTAPDERPGGRAGTAKQSRERRRIAVSGIVQGVGFRPFVYSLARHYSLSGWVRNDGDGVTVEVEGAADTLDRFMVALQTEAPPLAMVEAVDWKVIAPRREDAFRIDASRRGEQRRTLISPDVAICADCLRELFDPADRRYRYPFINCTNCGPRFTITRRVPYDRSSTTMSPFRMCPACQAEYDDPENRRFHAQPNACAACGPRVFLIGPGGTHVGSEDPIERAAELLRAGGIVAVKGLGGYHLACDPFSSSAVEALRARKVRQDKPFALMARSVEEVRALCSVGAEEESLLSSPARPIVLLSRLDGQLANAVAPGQRTLGVMLAYTPLHHLLLAEIGAPLVMTSGNRADEPIAYRDEEAREHLAGIADAFLLHDRPIHMRCDDSVVRFAAGSASPVRRSRGYAPAPLRVAEPFVRHVLACGGELKSTFCLGRDAHAFVSHHIGDLENYETLRSFQESIDHYCRLFDVRPQVTAYDLHPEYLSTKYAREHEEGGLQAVGVQHHEAHVASCLADNERPSRERAIGVALDGTGYGTDGCIWGGEFFTGSVAEGFTRRAHLAYTPLPGGVAAIRQPWRMAVAHLLAIFSADDIMRLPLPFREKVSDRDLRLAAQIVAGRVSSPNTSSAGRLFDAVAALVGLPGGLQTTYEGQAAIELEQIGVLVKEGYPINISCGPEAWRIETPPIIAGVVEDLRRVRSAGEISGRFHRTMVEIVAAMCRALREESGLDRVALSGGTFQNVLLLEGAVEHLTALGFTVYRHRRVPPNDGGLALGQAVLANALAQA
jgi:hydrogenase maturation protein HypF